jgi:hypothetical protein
MVRNDGIFLDLNADRYLEPKKGSQKISRIWGIQTRKYRSHKSDQVLPKNGKIRENFGQPQGPKKPN